METIIKVEETTFELKPKSYVHYDGYIITTDKQAIKIGISNEQSCCEQWGYFITNDEVKDFYGAVILDIKIVDDCLNVKKAPPFYEGSAMFINIETTKGTLQFVVYNEHNGYYSHEAVVISKQLSEAEYL